MKRLYPIILILLLCACNSGNSAGVQVSPTGTVPTDWLTRPPTPLVTSETDVQPGAAANLTEENASVDPVEGDVNAPTPPVAQTEPTPGFELPHLFGRQWTISAAPETPGDLIEAARTLAEQRPDDFLWVEAGNLPSDIELTAEGEEPLASWLYVVAAPFATIEDEITEDELRAIWTGAEAGERAFVIGADGAALLRKRWGTKGPDVEIVEKSELSSILWDRRPALTVMPFHELTPDLKVLRVGGRSPLDADFVAEDYALRLEIGADGEQEALAAFFGAWKGDKTNFDPHKLTRVALTGVTALVRATATQMEIDGILAPAADVGPLLREADVAHISNEVSFSPDCPEPNPIGGTSFCSQDEYFALLEEVGADVIELTGNHLNDWGADNLLRTLDMYEAAGMDYFGGGRDEVDAARVAYIDHNGNKIALVGCNFFGPTYAWATESSAGSRRCDPQFYEQIGRLHDEGYVVLATQQYTEYYQYPPTSEQQSDFRAIADAGAAAVSGSQGHHAQGFDFQNGAFIHYGLGNLFFDQMDMLGTRQTFVDTYNIYDGRLLNVDLWTGLIENYFLPRKMTPGEREQALQAVFQASGW